MIAVGHKAGEGILPCEHPRQFLNESGTDAARHIIEKETRAAKRAFQHRAKHPQREHIEENMRESASGMHEHICHELDRIETRGLEIVQSTQLLKT